MTFDLKSARKRGYEDEKIARFLGQKYDFDIDAAVKSGKSFGHLAEYLSTFDAPTRLEANVPRTPEWAGQHPTAYGMFGGAKAVYETLGRPGLEAAGMVGGGMIGAPVGPVGMAAGGAGGYAIAKKVDEIITNQINRIEGIEDKATIAEETISSLHDLKDGLIMEMVAQAAPVIPIAAYNKIMAPFASRMKPDAIIARDLAKGKGIEYTPAEQTGSRAVGAIEDLVEKSPASGDILRDFRFQKQLQPLMEQRNQLIESGGGLKDINAVGEKIYAEVTDYLQQVEKVKGKRLNQLRRETLAKIGTTQAPDTLGLSIQEIAQTRSIASRQRARDAYNEISGISEIQGKEFIPENMRDFAREEIKRFKGLPKEGAEAATKHLEWAAAERQASSEALAIADAIPPGAERKAFLEAATAGQEQKLSWDAMQAYEDRLTSLIQADNPLRDVQGYSQLSANGRLYHVLRENLRKDMYNIAEATGGDAWAIYRTADTLWKEYASTYKSKTLQALFKASPAKVIKTAIRPGAITEIKTFKNALGPEEFQKVKQGFSNELFKSPELAGSKEIFDPKALQAKLSQYGRATIEEVYGKRMFDELLELAEKGIDFTKIRTGTEFMKTLQKKHSAQIVEAIIDASGKRADTTLFYNLSSLKSALSETSMNSLEQQVIHKMFDINPTSGFVTPQSLVKMYDTHRTTLNWMNKKKANWLGRVVDYARPMSKTAGKAATEAAADASKGSVVSFRLMHLFFIRPVLGTVEAISTVPLAKLYLSKSGMKWLTEGFAVKAGTKRGLVISAKLAQLIAGDVTEELTPQYEE